ncbi:MAG: dCTP deaminase [Planctomycetia bacterium]|nr:dCTP deaminase [Planctomycetia bacterium]MBL6914111.1 dCTP deaminase [Planctomycetota bacterium]MDG1455536.1 dCTP deaminase [Planctomycetota bacterium]MDG2083843.1 dCTP deaminase [Planctomycetota bacterium]HCW44074.1 dCTP deaminase [Planctomycetota bacterium]
MSIKSDSWIRRMATEAEMIEPFAPQQVREKVDNEGNVQRAISYGVSSYGYDLRVADDFKVFTNVHGSVVDPKEFDDRSFVDIKTDCCIIPPNSFALARSIEYFRIPRNVLTICLGKSTYARCGIIVNVTPFEPEWEGHVTLEISNTTPLPAKVYANEGLAQVLFFESDEVCETSYGDRGGKYQGQTGINPPRM